jgi:hypothetical protein
MVYSSRAGSLTRSGKLDKWKRSTKASRRLIRLSVLTAAVLVACTGTAIAQERPSLKDVSAVRISNYGVPSKLFHGKEEVKAVVDELEQLRTKKWRQADLRMRCYATVQLLHGEKPLTVFRVRPEYVVERAQDKAVPTFNMQITEGDLPVIRKLLTDVPPSKDCG